MIAEVLSRIAGSVRSRQTTAREKVEAAAKAIAGGQKVDESEIAGALFDAGIAVEEFGALATLYGERSEKLSILHGLGAARKRQESADAAIAAEEKKHAEIVEAHRARWVALRRDADAAAKAVEDCRAARSWLLEIEHAPPSLRDRYREALDEEHAAQVAVADAERAIRKAEESIQSEERWIEQFTNEDARHIKPQEMFITGSGRDRIAAGVAEKIRGCERTIARLKARLAESKTSLAESQKRLVGAQAAVAAIVKQILAG